MTQIIIVGGGQAGFQAAASLRQEGFGGRVTVLCDEEHLPYQRPPLSKGYLMGQVLESGVILRTPSAYLEQSIEVRTQCRVQSIRRTEQLVELTSGEMLSYDNLVLATGASSRALLVPGSTLDGVCYMRSLDDAKSLRDRLDQSRRVVVIGGGFIGLEFAAVARKRGLEVHVLELGSRLLARVVSEHSSHYFENLHRKHGTTFTFQSGVSQCLGEDGRVCAVEFQSGEKLPCDLVLIGIGAFPNTNLAKSAGLDVLDGVVVNEHLMTSDSRIYAIGDCANFRTPYQAGPVRLESVQNAADQARCVAANLCGKLSPYTAVPWFWSDQYEAKLQIAGLTANYTRFVVKVEDLDSFSVFYFDDNRFLGLESVNRPADHLAARKILSRSLPLTPTDLNDASFNLKAYASFGAVPAAQ
jgi:3-phenylpropionate/trans-cinnamate dioxygenase ferredoxin reductase subunit